MGKKPIVELVRNGQRVPYRGQRIIKGSVAQHQSGAPADTIDIDYVFANFKKNRKAEKVGLTQG